ncbi:MAG TPA: PRC-barrel domain-containing protein [Dehalococcoidia bacterium]|nr:PRC-barrel domain-containing protein [Dehalococcoidia bacterium]
MARDASELMSLPVIATAEGRELGKVSDLVFDPERHALLGFVVASREPAGTPMYLSTERVRGLGSDAVTVDDEGALEALAAQRRAREIADSGIQIRGAKVITRGGDALGTVDRIIVDDDGRIAEYQVRSGPFGIGGRTTLKPEDVVAMGPDAIVVDARNAGATHTPGTDQGNA